MTYPVFNSVGPNVDVQLFGQAAETGAKLGQEIPSPITSVIQGGIKGYQEGQDIALKQAQIDESQAKAQIEQIQAEAAQINQDNNLETARLDAENNKLKAQKDNTLLKQGQTISDILSQGSPDDKKSLFGGQYADYWAANPKEEEQAIRSNWSLFNDSEKKFLGTKIFSAEQMRYLSANEKQNPQTLAMAKAFSDATANPDIAAIGPQASAITGHHVNDIEQFSYNLLPSNLYKANPDDPSKLLLDSKGKPVLSDTAGTSVPKEAARYNLVDQNGTIVSSLNYDAAKDYSKAQTAARALGFAMPLPQPIQGAASPEASFVGQTSGVPTFGVASSNGLIPSQPGTISEPSLANAQASGIIPQTHTQTTSIVPKDSTSSIDNAAAIDLNKKLYSAPPEVTAKAQSILASKQAANTSAITGQPVVTPTPQSTPTPAVRGLKDIISDFLVPKAHADELAVTGEAPQAPNTKVVDRVKTNSLLKDEHPLIQAMAAAESKGNSDAISKTGVKGLLQVTQDTARSYGLNRNIPEQNVLAGKLYIRDMLNQFQDLQLGLAAYNGGPGTIRQAINLVGSTDFKDVAEGLRFMKDQGQLTSSKFKEIVEYPSKVINYLKAFNE